MTVRAAVAPIERPPDRVAAVDDEAVAQAGPVRQRRLLDRVPVQLKFPVEPRRSGRAAGAAASGDERIAAVGAERGVAGGVVVEGRPAHEQRPPRSPGGPYRVDSARGPDLGPRPAPAVVLVARRAGGLAARRDKVGCQHVHAAGAQQRGPVARAGPAFE
ncbi:MAG TPA: hypothetical protein VF223_16710 [Trebonia sp.]